MKKKVARIIFASVSIGVLVWLYARISAGVTQGYFYALLSILGLLIIGQIIIGRIAEKKFGDSSMVTKLIDFLFLLVIVGSMVVLFAYIQPVP